MPFYDETNINIIGLIFLLVMVFLVLFLPRRYAIIPILMSICYMTLGQVINVGGLHFYIPRILILFGWVRLISRHEISNIRLNLVDKIFILWVIANVVIYVLQRLTYGSVVNRLGFAYDAIGMYFLFRYLYREFEDIQNIIRYLAILIVPLAILMLIERATERNFFAIFGGIPFITELREGTLRCQGPFLHPILAGTFGATLMPMFVALWFKAKNGRFLAVISIVSAMIIVLASGSTGPVIAFIFVILAFAAWPLRWHMRLVRWGIFLAVLSLHLVMKASVWSLIGRVGSEVGGDGWHRVQLIDAAIEHFNEWWLLGTQRTSHWMGGQGILPNDPDMIDITNQYISQGIHGGIITLLLFVLLISLCFREVGRALHSAREKSLFEQVTFWSLGVSLVAHVASFISVRYFDNNVLLWYIFLAIVSTIGNWITTKEYPLSRT